MTATKMSAFYHFLHWALALISFLLSLHLGTCDSSCSYLPRFSPSRLIVKYNDPASTECAVCQQACPTPIFKVETPIGKTTSNGTNLSWSVENLDEWEPAIFCYYEMVRGGHCRSKLDVTVYQPPTHVSISFVENSGQMLEGHEYTLRCTVQDVAPFENLTVTFYRGQTPLGSPQAKENKQTGPGNYTYTHTINVGGEDDGAHFRCEAKLVLGADGPQPPPVVESQNLTASVSYKPKLKGPSQPAEVTVTEGERLHLSCSAEGNPRPTYTWTRPSPGPHPKSIEVLTIDSVTTTDEGEYKCLVENNMGTLTVKVKVLVQVLTTTTLPPMTTETLNPTTKKPSPITRLPTTKTLENHSCRGTFNMGLMLFLFAVILL